MHGPGGVIALHVNVTWKPCSLPSGHPTGAPTTPGAVRFRLVPPGPTTNTRNVFPAFADVKFTSTSSNWHVSGFNCPLVDGFNPTVIVGAGLAPVPWKITLVTFVTPVAEQKHAPEISRF